MVEQQSKSAIRGVASEIEMELGEGAGWVKPGGSESTASPSRYWQADALAEVLLHEFKEAHSRGDSAEMRERFYLVSNFCGPPWAFFPPSLGTTGEPLLQATLHNLAAL